jgi:hypothetical protein
MTAHAHNTTCIDATVRMCCVHPFSYLGQGFATGVDDVVVEWLDGCGVDRIAGLRFVCGRQAGRQAGRQGGDSAQCAVVETQRDRDAY